LHNNLLKHYLLQISVLRIENTRNFYLLKVSTDKNNKQLPDWKAVKERLDTLSEQILV